MEYEIQYPIREDLRNAGHLAMRTFEPCYENRIEHITCGAYLRPQNANLASNDKQTIETNNQTKRQTKIKYVSGRQPNATG